ncbi:hypothetical protein MASR2M79_19630 [Aminivibrio sp.]
MDTLKRLAEEKGLHAARLPRSSPAASVASRIFILKDGLLVEEGTPGTSSPLRKASIRRRW